MASRPTRNVKPALALCGLTVVALFATLSVVSKTSPPASAAEPALVWHVETLEGRTLQTRRGDEPINPASLVKVATTLWALERLGPTHRFDTRFVVSGSLDPASGVLDGDLLVIGSGDPDFHVENAYLVAGALNRAGLREVRGSLRVNELFWIGWEGGSARREKNAARRAEIMAARLRDALDPLRWSAAAREAIAELGSRRVLDEPAPRVALRGSVGRIGKDTAGRELVVHSSNPLLLTLKRFNSFSNNDIERFQATLGSPGNLTDFLERRWGSVEGLRLSTLSGLGSNRMTSRQVVRLLDDLRRTSSRQGVDLRNLLPVAGCDPGTLEHFESLDDEDAALVAKTGTLTTTDGGVAVLAGLAGTRRGEILFCVAAPRAGGRLARARGQQQRWLLELVDGQEGWRPWDCGAPLAFSDDRAEALVVR